MNRKIKFFSITVLCFALFVASCGASTTSVESLLAPSLIADNKEENDELTYKVYLPTGYDADSKEGYPVLYLLHGSGGKVTDWDRFLELLDEMILAETIGPVLAQCINFVAKES